MTDSMRIGKFRGLTLLYDNKLISGLQGLCNVLWHVLNCLARYHVVNPLDISVVKLIKVKVVIAGLVNLQVLLDIMPVGDYAFAADRRHWVKIGMHGGDEEVGIIVLAGHDVLGTVKPRDPRLQALALG